nr:hypothetical protein B0A51_02617 [Rachicladosporium sp. CCFEE 5018]
MGFLTSFRSSRANSALQKFLRVIEFLSPVVSLGPFASRVAKIVRLGQQATTTSNKAVLGILGAAVLYTLIAMILQFTVKHGGPKILRWLMMLLDVLFIIAFIVVAVLTRPGGSSGSSGPCRTSKLAPVIPKNLNCNLPYGTFILSILSTFLHLITAAFHEVKDHRRNNRLKHDQEMKFTNSTCVDMKHVKKFDTGARP